MIRYHLQPLVASVQPEPAVLCRFPHGPPQELTSPSTASDLSFTLHAHTDTRDSRKAAHRILTAESAAVSYAATNYADQSYKLSPYTYALGVVRDKERRIDLLPVTHVYNMQQYVKRRASEQQQRDGDEAQAAEAETYAARQKALIDSFGSKKRKSQLASKESSRVVVQRQIADTLGVALATNQPDEEDDRRHDDTELMKATKAALLPPFDDTTDDPLRIYKLSSMIPQQVYSLLQTEATRYNELAKNDKLLTALLAALPSSASPTPADAVAATLLAQHDVSRFILRRLQLLSGVTDGSLRTRTCTLLAYYRLLLAVKLGSPRDVSGPVAALPHAPEHAVVWHLRSTFAATRTDTGEPSNRLDSTGSRRVLCWLLVVTLLVGRVKLDGPDVEAVAADVRMSGGEVVAMYRGLGCTGATRSEVQLLAPLSLGRFRRRQRRGAR